MNRWHTALLAFLCAAAISLGVLFALEHSRANEAEGRALASAKQVENLKARLEDLYKELRWALVVANARLAALGAEQVATPIIVQSSPPPAPAPPPPSCVTLPNGKCRKN